MPVPVEEITVTLTKEPVELYKILKFEGLVGSGAEAKLAIAELRVSVNGQVETRRRCKIYGSDTVEYDGTRLTMSVASD